MRSRWRDIGQVIFLRVYGPGRGAILNIKFMTSFAESNLSSWADFITLDPCLQFWCTWYLVILVTFLLQLLLNKSPYELHEGTAQLRPFEPNKKVVFSVLSRVIFIRW